jgi:hypothetical protein
MSVSLDYIHLNCMDTSQALWTQHEAQHRPCYYSSYQGAAGLNLQFNAIKWCAMNEYTNGGPVILCSAHKHAHTHTHTQAQVQAQVAYLNDGRMIDSYSSLVHSCTRDMTGSRTAASTSCVFISCCRQGQTCWNHSFWNIALEPHVVNRSRN